MKNRQNNYAGLDPLKKRLLLFALLLLISGAMFGQRPTVNTTAVTNITETSAVCGGRVVSEGGAPVDERGIYFNTTPNVGVGNMVIADSGGVGFFTINLTGLMPGTTYYVRAFAINAEGTSYGATLSFTTLAPCTITASANPSSGGSVSGNGTYNHGTTCTLTAMPNTGYYFVNWTENGSPVSTNAQYSFTVTGNRTLVANFSNSYSITATANPPSGGSVSGGGTYDYGTTCTLTANPSTGYHFVNWTENGQVVQNAGASYTFTVEGNRTLVANFAINTYTITASANPSSGGSVTQSGNGTYNHGTTCTLTATPNTGYHFVNWTENGSTVSTNAQYGFTVTGPRTLVANFEINSYLITAAANPSNGGTVSGGGTYNHGASCTLNATQSTGYTFINWTKNGSEVSNSPSYTFTVVEAGDYVANFTINQYTVTAQADPPAGGTVTGSGGFNYGETCTLVATANTGYTFVNWTKNGTEVSTTPTYSFTVTESAAYVAHFQINSYEITATANPSDGGTVSGGGTYNHFQNCTLTALQSEGHTFENWKKNGTQVSTNSTYTFMVEGAGEYVATFSLNQYTISTNVTPTGTGTVSGGGIYYYGDEVTLTATNEYGYHFDHWQDGNTDNPRTITVLNNALYTATFAPNSYTITTVVTPENTGTVTGDGPHNYGSICTLTATPNYGYHFDRWKENGMVVSNNASYTFQVSGDRTLEAHFDSNQFTITVTANPSSGGSVSGGGTYNLGQTVTLTATPTTGYHFLNWTENGQVVPNAGANYTFQVTGNRTLVANFEINSYTVTAIASGPGTVTGGGTYTHGQTATLTATANEHNHFVRWEDNSTQNPRQITVTGPGTYTAYFAIDQHTITANANPSDGGTVDGGGVYNYGSHATLTATPAPGYEFQKWQEDNVTTNPRTITVTGDATYTAKFNRISYVINVIAEPVSGGSVTGGGSYYYGDTPTLSAVANSGYTFHGWQDGNNENPRQITVTGNATYTAYFVGSGTIYMVTADVNPTGAGTVTGTGSYQPGATATLTATANDHYHFDHWQDTNADNPRQITVNSNLHFTAYFTQDQYTITVIADPTNGGAVSGGGNYHYGDHANLHAVANNGYTFQGWHDGNNDNPRQITVTGDATYRALFEETVTPEYTITVNADPANGGTVTGSGTYPEGTQVELTATANPGFNFIRWDDNETQPNRQIIVTGNATFTALFERQQYTVTTVVVPENGGVVTGGGTYPEGTEVTLTATPNQGYSFSHWQDGETDSQRTITVNEDVTYTATFTPVWYTITVLADPEDGGEVSGGGQYMYGETCTVSATENPGFIFANWTDEGGYLQSTDHEYTFTVTGNMTLVAHFAGEDQHIVFVDIDPLEGGTATGAGVYNDGEECTLKAFAKLGYHFVNWTRDGEVLSDVPTYTFIVNETSSYVAHFEKKKYTITASASPEEGGTVSGGGIYLHGVTCTLTAEPNAYYEFLHWKNNDGVIVSEEREYTFQVTADASFTAYFETNESYTISVSSNNSEWGTVEGGGTFNDGDICRLIAVPKEGYVFANWTEDGEVVPNAGPAYEFTVHRSRNLVANFTPDQYYIISAMASGNGSITPQGDIMVAVGGTQSFTMMPNEGCRIIKVLVDGMDVGPVESYTFTNVNRDHTIYAAFSGTGVEEAQSLGISIYPNPAKNKVYVEGDGIETMVLFDMFGNRMLNVDYNTSKELNVSGLPKGQYILVLTTRDGLVGYEKLVLH